MYKQDLILPENKRALFKIQLGTHVEEKEPGYPEKVVKEVIISITPPLVITIGDVCTETLIEADIIPDISITDGKTKRCARDPLKIIGATELRAKNPPGTISREAWEIIQEAMNRRSRCDSPVHILIDGEEDLLTIPTILEAPTKALVIYGQPDVEGRIKRGLVYIKVSDEVKRQVKGFVELMEKAAP